MSEIININDFTPKFTRYSYKEMLKLPPKVWLLDNVFGKKDIGVIFGPPGCGKTFVVIDLIMCLCMGKVWANRFKPIMPLNVAYCAGEGVSALPSRFRSCAAHHMCNEDDLYNFHFFNEVPQLFISKDSETLEHSISTFVWEWEKLLNLNKVESLDLLILDTLHSASEAADENSSKDMGIIIKACRQITKRIGCAVVLVHHTTKDGLSERGSSSLRGAADFMIQIEKTSKNDENTHAKMSLSKIKDGERWKEQGFFLQKTDTAESVHIIWDEMGSTENLNGQAVHDDKMKIIKLLKKYNGDIFTSPKISEFLGKKLNHTTKLLCDLVEEGRILRKLQDSNKSSSNRNPWVYFIQSSN